MHKRGSGILLPITSLPSPYGIGDLGPDAYRFADFLAETRQHYWQILPVNPILEFCGYSPYSSTSAFAGNIYLISPKLLVEDGLLSQSDIDTKPDFPDSYCDYDAAISYKEELFDTAYRNFKRNKTILKAYNAFCAECAGWLNDYALFEAIRKQCGGKIWNEWEEDLRDRKVDALASIKNTKAEEIERTKLLQYLFYRQWEAFKGYCNEKNIRLIGDIPIYVSLDSSDVWTDPSIFKLDGKKRPTHIAGVPPDYFSKTGQRWGNPVYQWSVLRRQGYAWWIKRMKHTLMCFDIVRVDHFRGLVAYWEIAAREPTAVNGRWAKVPAKDFITTLLKAFPSLPIIAEDLGYITQDVRDIVNYFNLPGMKVLLFAFGEENPMHPYLPHVYEKNLVVYTGTHDNNTTRGWFEQEAQPDDKRRLFRYIGRECAAWEVSRELIRTAMGSVADIAIIPMQDILNLGQEARMNIPGTPRNNWKWRLEKAMLKEEVIRRLSEMTYTYGRASS